VALSIREPRSGPAAKAVVSLGETLAFGRRNARLLLLVICAVVAWGFNGYGLLNWYPAMLERTFHASAHVVAWTYGPAFLVGGALGSVSVSPAVALMARRGHTNPLFAVAVWTLVAMTLATVAAPLMPNLPLAILFAFLTLLFSSATVTSIYSLITLIVPGALRGIYTAAYMAIMNITGGAFGAVIVGVLTDRWLGAAHLDYAMAIMAVVFGPLSVLLMTFASREYQRRPSAAPGPTPAKAHVVLEGAPPLAVKAP
jgi:MFS family permease